MLSVTSQSCENVGEDSPKKYNYEHEQKKVNDVINQIPFRKNNVHEGLNIETSISVLNDGRRLLDNLPNLKEIQDILVMIIVVTIQFILVYKQ